MKHFVQLYKDLEQSKASEDHVEALQEYLHNASEEDKLSMIALFTRSRPPRVITNKGLKSLALKYAGINNWLYEESYSQVGNQVETVSLILPPAIKTSDKTLTVWLDFIVKIKHEKEEQKAELIKSSWDGLSLTERFVFNKLLTASFRIKIPQHILVKAIAQYTGVREFKIANRMDSNWGVDNTDFNSLMLGEREEDKWSKPYDFLMPKKLEDDPERLGPIQNWRIEYLWEGLRVQIVKRKDQVYIWTHSGELVTKQYPEISNLSNLPNESFVIDGMIVPFKQGQFLPFQNLEKRKKRKKITSTLLEEIPVVLVCHDLLELEYNDSRHTNFEERQAMLTTLISNPPSSNIKTPLVVSESLVFESWSSAKKALGSSRKNGIKGMILKKIGPRDDETVKDNIWLKWKPESYTIDAILIYALASGGSRSSHFIEYTFGVWNDDTPVPIGKSYEGLSKAEHEEIRQLILANTIEKHGPVRVLNPELVFKISFQDIMDSPRHKSGIKLKRVEIKSFEKSKKAVDSTTLSALKELLNKKHIT